MNIGGIIFFVLIMLVLVVLLFVQIRGLILDIKKRNKQKQDEQKILNAKKKEDK